MTIVPDNSDVEDVVIGEIAKVSFRVVHEEVIREEIVCKRKKKSIDFVPSKGSGSK